MQPSLRTATPTRHHLCPFHIAIANQSSTKTSSNLPSTQKLIVAVHKKEHGDSSPSARSTFNRQTPGMCLTWNRTMLITQLI